MKTVKAMYNETIVEGEIIEIRRSQSIETQDNPDPVKVLLYKVRSKVPFPMRMWDDRIKMVTEAWVDHNSVIA